MRLRDLPDEVNHISSEVWSAALEVHRILGPYLLEATYRTCLAHELRLRGIRAEEEVEMSVVYKDLLVERAYKADIVVEGKVIVELKCADALAAEHEAQLMNYLRLSGIRLGLLFNMKSPRLRDDFRRRIL